MPLKLNQFMYAIMFGCWFLRLDIPKHVIEYVRTHEPEFACTVGEALSFKMIENASDTKDTVLRQMVFKTL